MISSTTFTECNRGMHEDTHAVGVHLYLLIIDRLVFTRLMQFQIACVWELD